MRGLRGIVTANSPDQWIPDQFQAFGGMPGSVPVYPGTASGVLGPGPGAGPNYGWGGLGPMGNGSGSGNGLSVNGGDGVSQGVEIGPAVLPQLSPMPTATTATMPTVTGTANAWVGRQTGSGNGQRGGKTPTVITPQYLNQRLPSIVNPAPVDLGVECGGGGIEAWVGDNPLLAGLGLVLAAWWVWGRR